MKQEHKFGGDWTEQKLKHVEKYLKAYATIMNRQYFKFAYIDAFAGTGYREEKAPTEKDQIFLFEKEDMNEIKNYTDGSARIALKITPEFDKYIFIESSKKHFLELNKLKGENKDKMHKIQIINTDANSYIKDICSNYKWKEHRAVMFLDPYGMQVEWDTIKAIASTEAIDLWYLFPLGVGVNRLLKKESDRVPDSWSKRLDIILGTQDWRSAFYKNIEEDTLFGVKMRSVKSADFSKITAFFVARLKTIFAGVADNPLLLFNSRNNPLYLLCFASGNPRGAKTAIKIAQDILKK